MSLKPELWCLTMGEESTGRWVHITVSGWDLATRCSPVSSNSRTGSRKRTWCPKSRRRKHPRFFFYFLWWAYERRGTTGDFNARVGNDICTWRGMIGGNGLPNQMYCCSPQSLSETNSMFQRGVCQCTWHQDMLGQRSTIDVIVTSDACVKRGALSSQRITTWWWLGSAGGGQTW